VTVNDSHHPPNRDSGLTFAINGLIEKTLELENQMFMHQYIVVYIITEIINIVKKPTPDVNQRLSLLVNV
jgi:hypothetical protein